MASGARPCACYLRLAQRRPWQTAPKQPFILARSFHQAPTLHLRKARGAGSSKLRDVSVDNYDALSELEAVAGVEDLRDLMPPEPELVEPRERRPTGFFADGEEGDDPGEDYTFQPDDITSSAHGELEQVRELRELERVIAWDMPLLYQHAQPFVPPTAQQPLRWKYTTFLGESHPAAKKVVVEFTPSALPDLTPAQCMKLLKLLGARYHPEKRTARMSCDQYPTVAQNKRHLGELLEKLLVEARDPTDMFEDIPLDTRHVKVKDKTKHLRFPDEWKLSSERVQYLQQVREAHHSEETRRINAGDIADGARLVGGPFVEEEFVAVRPRKRRN